MTNTMDASVSTDVPPSADRPDPTAIGAQRVQLPGSDVAGVKILDFGIARRVAGSAPMTDGKPPIRDFLRRKALRIPAPIAIIISRSAGAPEVVLSRSARDENGAPTTPSRWPADTWHNTNIERATKQPSELS